MKSSRKVISEQKLCGGDTNQRKKPLDLITKIYWQTLTSGKGVGNWLRRRKQRVRIIGLLWVEKC